MLKNGVKEYTTKHCCVTDIPSAKLDTALLRPEWTCRKDLIQTIYVQNFRAVKNFVLNGVSNLV